MTDIVLLLGLLAVLIVVPLWVYVDAEENSPHSNRVWTAISCVGNVIGLWMYLILGRNPNVDETTDDAAVDEWGR